jgi:hypothetical protein
MEEKKKWKDWDKITTIKVNRKTLYKLNKLRKYDNEPWSDILERSLKINNSLWQHILFSIKK